MNLKTSLYVKGSPAKKVEELSLICPLEKITSFFKRGVEDVLDLPEDAEPLLQPNDTVVFQEEQATISRENLANFIEYMLGRREQSSQLNSLLMQKSILHYGFYLTTTSNTQLG